MKRITLVALGLWLAAVISMRGQVGPMPRPHVPGAAASPDVPNPNIPLPQTGPKGPHSTRLGDLQVTFTAARFASDHDIQDFGLRPRGGYKVVLVFVTMK